LNPGRRGGKPATNRLSYGAAITKVKWPYDKHGYPVVLIPKDNDCTKPGVEKEVLFRGSETEEFISFNSKITFEFNMILLCLIIKQYPLTCVKWFYL
jgi:hypothetical protein